MSNLFTCLSVSLSTLQSPPSPHFLYIPSPSRVAPNSFVSANAAIQFQQFINTAPRPATYPNYPGARQIIPTPSSSTFHSLSPPPPPSFSSLLCISLYFLCPTNFLISQFKLLRDDPSNFHSSVLHAPILLLSLPCLSFYYRVFLFKSFNIHQLPSTSSLFHICLPVFLALPIYLPKNSYLPSSLPKHHPILRTTPCIDMAFLLQAQQIIKGLLLFAHRLQLINNRNLMFSECLFRLSTSHTLQGYNRNLPAKLL